MKKIVHISCLLLAGQTSAYDYCSKFSDNQHTPLVKELSQRLNYGWDAFCHHSRILDVQHELRRYFYNDSSEFEDHSVYTLHYNEYSCEYHYNLIRENWIKDKDYCYSTW